MENMKLLIHFLPPGVPSFVQDTEFIDVKPFLNYELKRPLDFSRVPSNRGHRDTDINQYM